MMDKFAYSAVAGVTTIVIFTIILAGVTFVHVESIRENQENINYIQGIIKSIYTDFSIVIDNNTIDIWNVTIQKNNEINIDITYHIIFKISSVPNEGEYIRFYYTSYKYNISHNSSIFTNYCNSCCDTLVINME